MSVSRIFAFKRDAAHFKSSQGQHGTLDVREKKNIQEFCAARGLMVISREMMNVKASRKTLINYHFQERTYINET